MTSVQQILCMLCALKMALVACAPAGPVEVLETDEADDASCLRVATCVERADETIATGRFAEALPYLVEGCQRGAADACRLLADGYALGSFGPPQLETAEALYRWGCDTAGDSASCHGLGELIRLGLVEVEREDAGAEYFRAACKMGEPAGCHDEQVVRLEVGEPDEDDEEQAVEVFETTCEQGLLAGCVNLGYMTAAGRGVGRDHDRADELFERSCQADDDWRGHRLAGLSHDVDPDVHAVAEFRPDVGCQQREVLVVGRYEERVMAAVDAESDRLRDCYDDARPDGEPAVGRITVRAGVTEGGQGVSPAIVDDELGLNEVAECVERMLSRHLADRDGGPAQYDTKWGISFVFPPKLEAIEDSDARVEYCDGRAVQYGISEIFRQIHRCGTRHMERHPDDPGVLVARWLMEPTGQVGEVAMRTTTTRHEEVKTCLEETIRQMEIDEFDGAACPVQLPFVLSDGRRLHFSVIGRP